MSPGKRKKIDPLEKAIEAALSPDRFISYTAVWSFVEDVQDGDDHRPLESVQETVPFQDLLLRSVKLRALPGRTDTQGAGPKGHVIQRGVLGRRRRHCPSGAG